MLELCILNKSEQLLVTFYKATDNTGATGILDNNSSNYICPIFACFKASKILQLKMEHCLPLFEAPKFDMNKLSN